MRRLSILSLGCLLGLFAATPNAGAAVLTTVGVPDGVAPGSVGATPGAFAPLIENFQGFLPTGSITQANTPNLNGTPLGGGTFMIGRPGDGAAPIFSTFGNQAGNNGVTLLAGPATAPLSFLATGNSFTSLGFLLSDFGSDTSDDLLRINLYSDLAGTSLVDTFLVDMDSVTTQFINGQEVVFFGVSSPSAPFARLDFFSAGTLLNDSVQVDDVRATFAQVPEPSTFAIGGAILGLAGVGFFLRRRNRTALVAV